MNIYEFARFYADLGWAVVPCQYKSKRPLVQWTLYQKRKPTTQEISEWFTKETFLNIGVITGIISNVVVLDVDDLDAIKGKELPITPCARTGRGGSHYFFKHPGFVIRNFAKVEGFDLRGDGGLIVLPPSTHPNGQAYQWVVSPQDVAMADMPDWLLKLCSNGHTRLPVVPIEETEYRSGERNHALTKLAGKLRYAGLDAATIEPMLQIANQQKCKPPLTNEEVNLIANSIGRYPAGETRTSEKDAPTTPTSENEAQSTSENGSSSPVCGLQLLNEQLANQIKIILEQKTPKNERRLQVCEMTTAYLERSGFFLQTLTDKYYFYNATKKLYNLEHTAFTAFLHSVTGVNPASVDYEFVLSYVKTVACQAPQRTVHRVAYFDTDQQVLYVSRFDGTVYVLDGSSIVDEENGKTVLFDDDGYDPYLPTESNTDYLWWLTNDLPNWSNDRDISGLTLRAWMLSTFFTELCSTKPILVMLGEKGSGKSMTLRIFLKLLMGTRGEVTGIPDKPDGFTALAASSRVLVIDNLDQFTDWLRDKVARIATGANDGYRKLWTNNERGDVQYACWLAFTTRTGDTLRRDDLVDRTVILNVNRFSGGEFQAERTFIGYLKMIRNEWWQTVLNSLNGVVHEIRENGLRSHSVMRLTDWETLGAVVAQAEGSSATWDKVVESLGSNQEDFLLEGDKLVTALLQWVVDNNGRSVTTDDLYNELTSRVTTGGHVAHEWFKTQRSFVRHLRSIREALKSILNVEWADDTNRNKPTTYTFSQK